MSPGLRVAARGVAVLFLGGSALAEAGGLPGEWAGSVTTMQQVVVLGELGMILAGLVGAAGVMLRRAWAVPAAVAWAASTTLAGGLAPRAFGNTPWSVSATAAVVCVLIGTAVVWLTRAGVRAPVGSAPVPR